MTPWIRLPVRAFFRALGYFPVTLGGLPFKVDPEHIGFWREAGARRWEPRALEALGEHLTPSSCYVDIGAWIGPTALYAARRAGRVFCIEPDSVAYGYLLANIRRNRLRNVVPFHVALGARSGLRRAGAFGERLGGSRTSLLSPGNAAHSIEVWCLRWSDWAALAGVGRVDFIKMDIEGGEFELLPDMGEYLSAAKPALHVSLHAPLLPAEERESALLRAVDALGGYGKCVDDAGRVVTRSEILEASRDRFASYLFLP